MTAALLAKLRGVGSINEYSLEVGPFLVSNFEFKLTTLWRWLGPFLGFLKLSSKLFSINVVIDIPSIIFDFLLLRRKSPFSIHNELILMHTSFQILTSASSLQESVGIHSPFLTFLPSCSSSKMNQSLALCSLHDAIQTVHLFSSPLIWAWGVIYSVLRCF